MAASFLPMVGFLEILFLFGGGLGVPVGVPPAQEDAFLSRIAPDDCIYFTTWAAMATPDGSSANRTEQMLADPEIQRAVQQLESRLVSSFRQMAAREGDPAAQMAADMVPEFLKAVMTEACTIYLADMRFTDGPNRPPEVEAAFVMKLGDREDRIMQMVARLLEETGAPATETTIAGSTFQRIQPPDGPEINIGIHQGYLIVSAGEGAVQALLERAETPPPTWLEEIKNRAPVPRRSSVSMINVERILQIATPMAPPQANSMIQAIGIGNLQRLDSVAGLDDDGFINWSHLTMDGAPQGFMKVIDAEPLGPADLQGIPADASVAVAVRMNAGELLDEAMRMVAQIEPRAAGEMARGMQQMESMMGFRLREDLLQSLGDVWTVSTSPGQGGIAAGWLATVSVNDRAKLENINQRMIGFTAAMAQQSSRSPVIRQVEHGENVIYYMVIPEKGVPVTPAWCVTDDTFMVALFPQAIQARLSAQDEDSLATVEEVSTLLEDGALSVGYYDTRSIFETFYPLAQFGLSAMSQSAREEGVDIDVTLLPSTYAISRYLGPSVSVTRRVDDGVESITRQTLPGGGIGATAPVTVALLLPAVQSARAAARRVQGSNNLKQIGLAFHNYHEVFRTLPPQYSTDEGGKPLLSWRVYLLPFLEHQQLYEEFRLDEPWDSDHNRRLIERMPAVYRSPSSTAPEGFTTYVAPFVENGILIPPAESENGKERPQGTSFRTITDGTSNTMMVVEASDQVAVPWTKPEDYEVPENNSLSELLGQHFGGINVLFADGSVRTIAEDLPGSVFRAFLTRNGAEPIEYDFRN